MAPMNNSLVLTAHSRLASWLLLDLNRQQKQKKVWETPNVLPLSGWLKKAWLETWPEKYLLSNIQSENLWKKIIRDDPYIKGLSLLHKEATADQAAKAYALIKEYRIPLEKKIFNETVETFSFYKWVEEFDKQLLQWNAIDESSLMDRVSKSIDENKINLPSTIIFKGFKNKTPQLQYLLHSLERKNVSTHLNLPDAINNKVKKVYKNTTISVQKYDDKSKEVTTCARWIRKNYQPDKRFGIIVPDLKNYRSLIKRELAAELCPESIYPEKKMELPFNVSLGSPLSETAPINLILQILKTPTPEILAGNFYSIIKSPVFHLEKIISREIETNLRKQRKYSININKFPLGLYKEKAPQISNLITAWKNWISIESSFFPNKWAQSITEMLSNINWPGEKEKLTEKENHIYESWKKCLDHLTSLNSILGRIQRIEAVEYLISITERCFFPEKSREHLIQVIKLSESREMQFDHTWVVGCHFESLPPSPEPNTLIPLEYRKKHQLPHSNAKWELENSEQFLENIFHNSPDIVLSYPSQDGDTLLEPSPIIKNFPTTEDFILPSSRIKDQISNTVNMEFFQEVSHLSLIEEEKNRFEMGLGKGGANLLKFQSDCPFQAFARIRLHALNPDIPDTDFDSLSRGKLIHRILEIFWKKVRTRTELEILTKTGKLSALLNDTIQHAMDEFFKEMSKQVNFLELEKSRNFKLLIEWLTNFELTRDDFSVIEQEKKVEIKFDGLSLSLRIDRIDQTADKKQILIDYKTGEANPSEWFTERLLSPQLPLYSNLISPMGVYYAQIKKGEMGIKGVQYLDNETSSIQFIKIGKPQKFLKIIGEPTWENLISHWKNKTSDLVNEFLSGRLSIQPALKQNTCRNCDLKSFCRIWEWEHDSEGNGL